MVADRAQNCAKQPVWVTAEWHLGHCLAVIRFTAQTPPPQHSERVHALLGTEEQWELGASSLMLEKTKLKAKILHFYPPNLFKSQLLICRSLHMHSILCLVHTHSLETHENTEKQ